ncbi:MAG: 16S rRNA (cytidine(1402)-2'-O)-methyltransferase [Acidiferrobacteraceae bacterium]|jgi:16S rRNA (cytidine1402-2'-O)-methyltransferase
MSNERGTLYLVATPIGNLGDMSARAIETLKKVDLIAAEDTRHSAPLLRHFSIATTTTSFHEHNEAEKVGQLVDRLRAGEDIALISDAGTPLVNDPGYRLVRAARDDGLRVVAVPGPCAAIAALSVSGLPTDEFVFAGFPPPRREARRRWFQERANERRTQIFYESPHRIVESLEDMAAVYGGDRAVAVARELTKRYETVLDGPLVAVVERVRDDPNQQKGEFVVLLRGREKREDEMPDEAVRTLEILASELPPRQAAALASQITGLAKNRLYRWLVNSGSGSSS